MTEKLSLPRLSIRERDRRWRLIRESMSIRGLDCLVIYGHSGKFDSKMANVQYVTHIGGNGEEGMAIFPLEGEPTFLIWAGPPSFIDWWQQAQDWVNDIRPGRGKWATKIAERIGELGLEDARIGVAGLGGMLDRDGDMPYGTYMGIVGKLPKARFENATDIIESARLLKSPEEIGFIEKAAELGDLAIDALVRTAKPGISELEIFANMEHAILKNGGQPSTFIAMEAGPTVRGQAQRLPTSRLLRSGDIILNEISAKYGGYWAHPGQPVAMGEPTKEYKDMFELWLESFNAGLGKLTPGVSLDEATKAFTNPIEEAGFVSGHSAIQGIGLANVEAPSGETPKHLQIKAGMVVAAQPSVITQDGRKGMTCQDTIVVTESGPRRLSKRKRFEIMVA